MRVVPENALKLSTNQSSGFLLVSSNEFACIKEIRLQRRKYQWARFDNVSLQAGFRTTVVVKKEANKIDRKTASTSSWLLEERPPLAPASKGPLKSLLFPLANEAVGYGDWDGQFHPIMDLAEPYPRSGSEDCAEGYLPSGLGSMRKLSVYRGTNELATANVFLGEFQIAGMPSGVNLNVGFRLIQSGSLYLDLSGKNQKAALDVKQTRLADPEKKKGGIRYKLSQNAEIEGDYSIIGATRH